MFAGFNNENKSNSLHSNSADWQNLGAEIVFTQNKAGEYLSFWWSKLENYGLSPNQIIGFSCTEVFTPIDTDAYLDKINRIIRRRIPEQSHCFFSCQDYSFAFELVISPILSATDNTNSVMVIGHFLEETEIAPACQKLSPVSVHTYQKLLAQITRQIRGSLDLKTIWEQAVQSLGDAFCVSRCVLLSQDQQTNHLKVEAEYCVGGVSSILGSSFVEADEPFFHQALQVEEPVVYDQIELNLIELKSVLMVATSYNNKRNAIICLQQCDRYRSWNSAEVELLKELSEHVGTAIAHARLYQDLELASIQAEEASRLKSDFLANTSHELRTPLNGIIGFLKLLLEGMADNLEEQREFLQEAYRSSLHLLNLINDILDIAKIEAGKMDLELSDLELSELLQDVDNLIHNQADQKNINFKIKCPPTLTPITIYGNYQRLLQIMLNLVGNAIKFTHEGGVVISVELSSKKITYLDNQFPGSVKISVADTGIGVSLEKQNKLFENFFQVDGSRTKSYGGTGLGLAISQKLIQAMGGEVSFYSMGEDLGSTVTFTVPLSHLPVFKTIQQS